MSPTATRQAVPDLPPQPLSSALARGLAVGLTATLLQAVLLSLALDLCGIVTVF